MKTRQLVIGCAVLCAGGIWLGSVIAGTQEPRDMHSDVQKTPAVEIGATAGISPDHPEIPAGVSCVDCHEVAVDAATSATEVWLRGNYIKYGEGEGIMPPERIRSAIVTMIGGKKQARTMVLATCINNTPLSTTADFVLDPATMTLYGLHEVNTVKLHHIRQNPRVSLNWHEDFESWGMVKCLQIIGRAELLEGTSPEFERVLIEMYPYEELARGMKLELGQAREMVRKGMLLSKISVAQVTANCSEFEKNGFRKYQQWKR
jgi:nitroimidazol reductase NimA-like FMN-containing flavoprotein (pyridoxamine 5'-phosphate oxidase superfamily)